MPRTRPASAGYDGIIAMSALQQQPGHTEPNGRMGLKAVSTSSRQASLSPEPEHKRSNRDALTLHPRSQTLWQSTSRASRVTRTSNSKPSQPCASANSKHASVFSAGTRSSPAFRLNRESGRAPRCPSSSGRHVAGVAAADVGADECAWPAWCPVSAA